MYSSCAFVVSKLKHTQSYHAKLFQRQYLFHVARSPRERERERERETERYVLSQISLVVIVSVRNLSARIRKRDASTCSSVHLPRFFTSGKRFRRQTIEQFVDQCGDKRKKRNARRGNAGTALLFTVFPANVISVEDADHFRLTSRRS